MVNIEEEHYADASRQNLFHILDANGVARFQIELGSALIQETLMERIRAIESGKPKPEPVDPLYQNLRAMFQAESDTGEPGDDFTGGCVGQALSLVLGADSYPQNWNYQRVPVGEFFDFLDEAAAGLGLEVHVESSLSGAIELLREPGTRGAVFTLKSEHHVGHALGVLPKEINPAAVRTVTTTDPDNPLYFLADSEAFASSLAHQDPNHIIHAGYRHEPYPPDTHSVFVGDENYLATELRPFDQLLTTFVLTALEQETGHVDPLVTAFLHL